MRDKKHIDRLFKEGLKDFEPAPSNAVWEKIEAELNKGNKKRRIVPIWWRYAGVAALFLAFLALGISNTFFNKPEGIERQEVSDTETTRSSKEDNKNILGGNGLIPTDVVIPESVIPDEGTKQNTEIVKTPPKEKDSQTKLNSNIITKVSVALSNRLSKSKQSAESVITKIVADSVSDNSTVVSSYKAKNNLNLKSAKDVGVVETRQEEKVKSGEAVVNNKESITIEEALDKANSIIIEKKEKNGRWSIAANAAPVYFNTSGEGSAIDPQFNSNSKSGEVYISYGISASYALTDRLSIRSGISNLSLGYNTDNVVVYESAGVSSASSKPLQNVSASTSKISTVRVSSGVKVISGEGLDALIKPSFINESRTSINQNLRYVEVPVELQYALINKKIGLNIIGGFSSLFLNGNEIFTDTERTNSYFSGEASNINKVSYSANFGVGLNYQVSKKIGLNLEPMLKYQINTFKNTFGDFQPFFVGVYTGVAIKF